MINNESTFVRFEPCPKCGSRDNLSVWSDGHKYCFGCNFRVKGEGNSLESISSRLKTVAKVTSKVMLPSDASFNLPEHALEWLAQYYVNAFDGAHWKLKYSNDLEGLILPIYDDAESLVMYQVRKFYTDGQTKPKYVNFGKLGNHIPVFGEYSNDTVVLVEDYISARRVGALCNAVPLLGSNISQQLITRLSKSFSRLLIWLDNDKSKYALETYSQYEHLFEEVQVEISPHDPKTYDDAALFSMVYGAFDYDNLTDPLDVV